MKHLLLCVLLSLGVTSAWANGARLFQDAFAGGDVKAWSLQPAINAIGPIPANGTWALDSDAWVATGTAAPWTVQTAGNAAWTDYQLSAKVTIRKPTPAHETPVGCVDFDYYLSHDDFPAYAQHSGQYRYHYYAGEFDWGSDAAVFVRYQDRNACYRIQLSSRYQEMILWNGNGGYLQVVPCAITPGQTYALTVRAQGAHLLVTLDGKTVIDYWHTCMPSLNGGIGLAAYNSTVAFQQVQVTMLPALTVSASPHHAKFFTRAWRGIRTVFDNNEPIMLMEKNLYTVINAPDRPTPLRFEFIKLRPGYRPYYYNEQGIVKNDAPGVGLATSVDAIPVIGEQSSQLIIQFDSVPTDADKSISSRHTDRLTYDSVRGTYRHDMTIDVTFLRDQSVYNLEYADPLTFNNHRPGRGVKYGWIPSNDDWGIFDGEDGKIYRHPISIGLLMGEGWYTEGPPSFWMLYPARAACPVFEHLAPKERTWIIVCHWGHDYHNSVRWEARRAFKKDEVYTIHYVMTAYTQEEGERLFLKSQLDQTHAHLEDKQQATLMNYVPSPYAFPVMDPAGTSFEQLTSAREPFTGWHTMGDYTIDNTMGHTDHYSLRLDGPSSMTGTMYHNMLDLYGKKYLCTLWLKTKGVTGNGPRVTMKYTFLDKPCDTYETGLNGDNDWQEFSFITTVPTTHDSTDIIVEHTGTGTVWVDDFSLRPIEDGENVIEHRPTPKPIAAVAPSADFLLSLPCNEGAGVSLNDVSNHGNAAKLHGAQWVAIGARSVIHLEKGSAAFVPILSPELTPGKEGYAPAGLTLEAWVRPARGNGVGAIFGYGSSPVFYIAPAANGQFSLNLTATAIGKGAVTATSTQFMPADAWTHVAAVLEQNGAIRLYVNGKKAGEKPFDGKLGLGGWGPMISIGVLGKFYGEQYLGDLAALRWWTRAATDAEIAAAATHAP